MRRRFPSSQVVDRVKKVGAGMIFTCIIEDITEDLSPPPDIRWRGPTGSEITATVGRFVP